MKKEFKIGDRVRIKSLMSKNSSSLNGKIGHEGTITKISSNGYYTLEPWCIGTCWPAECLEYVEIPENYNIFN